MKKNLFILLSLNLYSFTTAAPFPGTLPGVDVGHGLPSNFEPSGGAWHPRLNRFFVVGDNGAIARLDVDGISIKTWSVKGNWEGVAVADPNTNFIYIIDESKALLHEFDFEKGKLTNRIFKLTEAVAAPGVASLTNADKKALIDNGDNAGAEALTFVPDAQDPEGGLFYVGSQENGTIYKFRASLSTGNSVTFLGKFKFWTDKDLAGLEYDWNRQVILAVWDSQNRIRALHKDGRVVKQWNVPSLSKGEEGLAYDGFSLFITEDDKNHRRIRRYDHFRYE